MRKKVFLDSPEIKVYGNTHHMIVVKDKEHDVTIMLNSAEATALMLDLKFGLKG